MVFHSEGYYKILRSMKCHEAPDFESDDFNWCEVDKFLNKWKNQKVHAQWLADKIYVKFGTKKPNAKSFNKEWTLLFMYTLSKMKLIQFDDDYVWIN